jgi:hypothetical protein
MCAANHSNTWAAGTAVVRTLPGVSGGRLRTRFLLACFDLQLSALDSGRSIAFVLCIFVY